MSWINVLEQRDFKIDVKFSLKSHWEFLHQNIQESSDKCSDIWKVICHVWWPQGSILNLLLVLIYLDNQSYHILSMFNLSADDISLFVAMHGSGTSVNELNKGLQGISKWLVSRKPHPILIWISKLRKWFFSMKLTKSSRLKIIFNNTPVFCAYLRKH